MDTMALKLVTSKNEADWSSLSRKHLRLPEVLSECASRTNGIPVMKDLDGCNKYSTEQM